MTGASLAGRGRLLSMLSGNARTLMEELFAASADARNRRDTPRGRGTTNPRPGIMDEWARG